MQRTVDKLYAMKKSLNNLFLNLLRVNVLVIVTYSGAPESTFSS